MSDTHNARCSFSWSTADTDVDALSTFFVQNVPSEYISHSEIQFGRAIDQTTWSPQLHENIKQEILEKSFGPPTVENPNAIAVAEIEGQLVALSVVACHFDVPIPFATLEDIVVGASLRNHGVGAALLSWIEANLKDQGMKRIFLESGTGNDAAHHFFERLGFDKCSIVMMKEL